jgi:hypothetical protein
MNVKVFRKNETQRHFPLAEGEAVDIAKLLVMWGTVNLYDVYDGKKSIDAREFVTALVGSVLPAESSETPEEKMRREDSFDPYIHARNVTVEQWIARAIRLSNEPNYVPYLLAKNTAYEIIRLFY